MGEAWNMMISWHHPPPNPPPPGGRGPIGTFAIGPLNSNLFKVFFTSLYFNIQDILFRWEHTDEFVIVDTSGIIGHIEI